jgi:hypothetical protein
MQGIQGRCCTPPDVDIHQVLPYEQLHGVDGTLNGTHNATRQHEQLEALQVHILLQRENNRFTKMAGGGPGYDGSRHPAQPESPKKCPHLFVWLPLIDDDGHRGLAGGHFHEPGLQANMVPVGGRPFWDEAFARQREHTPYKKNKKQKQGKKILLTPCALRGSWSLGGTHRSRVGWWVGTL